MTKNGVVIDLVALVAALPPEFADLAGMARSWFSRHSCDADLGVAEAYLHDAIRWHSTKRESLANAKGALLQSAVVHYARAFDPASRHRSHISIERYLDVKEKAFHRLLIDLRHESLAHFGPAGDDDSPWSEDIPALIVERGQWQPMIASKRPLYRSALALRFLNHVKKIRPIVTELSDKSKSHFTEVLSKRWEESSTLSRLIESHTMDPQRLGGWSGPFLGGPRSGREIQILSDDIFSKGEPEG